MPVDKTGPAQDFVVPLERGDFHRLKAFEIALLVHSVEFNVVFTASRADVPQFVGKNYETQLLVGPCVEVSVDFVDVVY